MVEIVIPDDAKSFKNLKIAGDFTNWEVKSMEKHDPCSIEDDDIIGFHMWVFEITTDMVKPYINDDGASELVLHFKFIDDNNNWFTSDNFDQVPDENNNINNAIQFQLYDGELLEDDVLPEPETDETKEVGPVSPAPSLTNIPNDEKIEEIINNEEEKEDPTVLDAISDDESTPTPVAQLSTPKKVTVEGTPGDETLYYSPTVTSEDPDELDQVLDQLEDNEETESVVCKEEVQDEKIVDNTLLNSEIQENDGTTPKNNKIVGATDHTKYKNFLKRLLNFLSALLGSWFEYFKHDNNNNN